jgi:hypothetical protein
MTLRLSRAEAEALLRALDLVRIHALARGRPLRPGALRLEEAVEAKLLQALRAVRR